MSDSEDSTVTYTEVSSPFEDLSDIGSLGVIIHGYDGLPMIPEDPYAYDNVLPAEEQPLPVAVLPIVDSPGYITEFDPEEDPEEEDDEDHEEDPADYPTDRDDEEEEESSGDDADEEEKDEDEDDEEEEEHLASADSVPPPAYRTIARMYIRAETPIPFSSEAEVDRLLVVSTPPSSPITSYSSPLPQIPSPPLPSSSPYLYHLHHYLLVLPTLLAIELL
ncbi:hypothetical protein Tco_1412492 [Tanacetum coccineum]